jgi:predicted dehydrogenase
MGLNHVRAYADLPSAKLVCVVDIERTRADKTAKEFSCDALYDARDLIDRVDAVTIATPPEFHAATAVVLLKAGIACLIEKPLALTDTDCRAIVDAAESSKTVVAVGHVERFNPAAETLMAQGLTGPSISSISVERLSPATGRQMPVDVVSDMMIHDLDVVLALKGCDVVDVTASGGPESHVSATLNFSDGTTARLTANRKAEARRREMTLTTTTGNYVLDFMARTVTCAGQNVLVRPHDALRAEIGDFLTAVQTKSTPRVTAPEALAAMHVVWRILAAIGRPTP